LDGGWVRLGIWASSRSSSSFRSGKKLDWRTQRKQTDLGRQTVTGRLAGSRGEYERPTTEDPKTECRLQFRNVAGRQHQHQLNMPPYTLYYRKQLTAQEKTEREEKRVFKYSYIFIILLFGIPFWEVLG